MDSDVIVDKESNDSSSNNSSSIKKEHKHAMKQLLVDVEETDFTTTVHNGFRDIVLGPITRGIFWAIGAEAAKYVLDNILGFK